MGKLTMVVVAVQGAPSQGGIHDYAENQSGVAVGVFCVV